jgi:excisionase family DNA binding protein
MEETWLLVDDICTYLRVSRDTVYKWVQFDFIPYHKVGKLLRFHKDEIDRWILSGEARIPPRKDPS